MSDPNIPVLCLVDALVANGFRSSDALCVHSRGSAKAYDGRRLASKRCYFQCLLSRDALFRKGQRRFRSDQSQAYYKLLMRAAGPIPEQATARECQEKIVEIEAAGEDYPVPAALLATPAAPAPGGGLRAIADVDGDDGHEGPETAPPQPIVDAERPAVHGDGADGGYDVPEFILGQPVSLEVHWRGGQGLRVQCPVHPGCTKYRSLALDVHLFGPAAAKHFLATWLRAAESKDAGEHSRWKPTRAQIQEYLGEV